MAMLGAPSPVTPAIAAPATPPSTCAAAQAMLVTPTA